MKPFVGQREALINQASEMQVVILWHAAGDDDEMLANLAIGELASHGQIEAVVEHFRPEATEGDPASMKAMFYALMTAGGRDEVAEGMRLLDRIADGGDAWGIATRERARAYEREHAAAGSATGFGPRFDRATAALAAANGEQMACFSGYCDPEGYEFSFEENKLIGLGSGPDLTGITVLGTYSHTSKTWLWMWASCVFTGSRARPRAKSSFARAGVDHKDLKRGEWRRDSARHTLYMNKGHRNVSTG